MKLSSFVTLGSLYLTTLSAWTPAHTLQRVVMQEEIAQTLWCGKYFMDKIHSLDLSFNRFYNDPYFIFRDCDGNEQRIFIVCECGVRGYEINKYGNTYLENENNHPELDILIDRLEQSLSTGSLFITENENGELIYEVRCG
jgi:hypothetical protein